MIYIHKILPLLASPLFLIMILVLWGSLFRSKRAGLAAISILFVCSLPLFSNKLKFYLEGSYSLVATDIVSNECSTNPTWRKKIRSVRIIWWRAIFQWSCYGFIQWCERKSALCFSRYYSEKNCYLYLNLLMLSFIAMSTVK